MRQRIRSHLTYANVMATIAVFIALGGGTTAVALNGSNTVQSDDLRPGAQVQGSRRRRQRGLGADVANRLADRSRHRRRSGVEPFGPTLTVNRSRCARSASSSLPAP